MNVDGFGVPILSAYLIIVNKKIDIFNDWIDISRLYTTRTP